MTSLGASVRVHVPYDLHKPYLLTIARDFTLASHNSKDLNQLQRKFIEAIIQAVGDSPPPTLLEYTKHKLLWHMKGGLIEPYSQDELARRLALHSDTRTLDTISGQVRA